MGQTPRNLDILYTQYIHRVLSRLIFDQSGSMPKIKFSDHLIFYSSSLRRPVDEFATPLGGAGGSGLGSKTLVTVGQNQLF